MGLMAARRLEVMSEYVFDVCLSCLFTRPDDSSQLYYLQESASFCLCSEERKQKQEGRGKMEPVNSD